MKEEQKQPEYMSPTAAAKILGICPRLVSQLCHNGEIEYARVRTARLVTLAELRRWLRSRTEARRTVAEAEEIANKIQFQTRSDHSEGGR